MYETINSTKERNALDGVTRFKFSLHKRQPITNQLPPWSRGPPFLSQAMLAGPTATTPGAYFLM